MSYDPTYPLELVGTVVVRSEEEFPGVRAYHFTIEQPTDDEPLLLGAAQVHYFDVMHPEVYHSADAIDADCERYVSAVLDREGGGIREGVPGWDVIPMAAVSLSQLHVLPQYQRQGIAGVVVEALVEYFATMAATMLVLPLPPGDDRAPWLRGFYEKHGFEPLPAEAGDREMLARNLQLLDEELGA